MVQMKGKCDRALLALLLACGLRRHELASLTIGHLDQREEHWAIVDVRGTGGHVRTIPVPDWARCAPCALPAAFLEAGGGSSIPPVTKQYRL